MANEDVVVRIGVTGADKAKADLQSVGDTAGATTGSAAATAGPAKLAESLDDVAGAATAAGAAQGASAAATATLGREAARAAAVVAGGVSPALGGAAAAAAGLGAAISPLLLGVLGLGLLKDAFDAIAQAVAEAEAKMSAMFARIDKRRNDERGQAEKIVGGLASELADEGSLSEENLQRAFNLTKQLLAEGVNAKRAVELAAAGTVAGVTSPSVLANIAAAGDKADAIKTPEQVAQFAEEFRRSSAATQNELDARRRSASRTPEGLDARQLAALLEEFDTRRLAGGLGDAARVRAARDAGLTFTDDKGEQQPVQSERDLSLARQERERLIAVRDRERTPAERVRLQELEPIGRIDDLALGSNYVPEGPGRLSQGATTIINNVTNANMIINNVPPRSISPDGDNLTH